MTDESTPPIHNQEGQVAAPAPTRRSFFGWMTGAIAAIIGVGMAVPLTGYVVLPAFKRRKQTYNPVGTVDDLPIEEPKSLDYLTTTKDGWLETKVRKAVWAVRHSDNQVTVFSPICTHLGCGYRWDESAREFKCPCHQSVFALSGKVVGGPAPRPLDVLPSKIEDGKLLVKYEQFKSGIAQKVRL